MPEQTPDHERKSSLSLLSSEEREARILTAWTRRGTSLERRSAPATVRPEGTPAPAHRALPPASARAPHTAVASTYRRRAADGRGRGCAR